MTPNEVIQYLNRMAIFIKEGEQEMQVLVTSTMAGKIGNRIFNNLDGSKNSKDESLGFYSPEYAKQKAKKFGKSLSTKVNLYATGTLFGSLKQVNNSEDTYLAITDVKYQTKTNTVKVSQYIDEQYGTTFAPTTKEEEQAIAVATKYADKRAKEFNDQNN